MGFGKSIANKKTESYTLQFCAFCLIYDIAFDVSGNGMLTELTGGEPEAFKLYRGIVFGSYASLGVLHKFWEEVVNESN
jgi:hypothetical protein